MNMKIKSITLTVLAVAFSCASIPSSASNIEPLNSVEQFSESCSTCLTPLMQAAASGNLPKIENLFSQGVSLTEVNENGASALYFAAQNLNNSTDIYEFFRQNLSKSEFESLLSRQVKSNSHTVAFEATFNLNIDLLNYLLSLSQSNYDVNFSSASVFAWTPKTFAERESISIAEVLPEGEVKVENRLEWMQERENVWFKNLSKEEKLYHDKGALFIRAISKQDLDEIDRLLDQGVDINGHYGRLEATPLNSAVWPKMTLEQRAEAKKVIFHLLSHEADLNNREGGIMKVAHGFRESVFGYAGILSSVIEYIKENGTQTELDQYLNAQGPLNGYTKLIDAALRGQAEVIEVLMDNDADKEIQGYNGLTAYKAALIYNQRSENPLSEDIMQQLQ
ncbi:hypothetical protein ACSKZ4_004508 [Vibrio alginolyticus]|nr:ankyrin repeat domain-containing protein [Vibrio alginolyticus]